MAHDPTIHAYYERGLERDRLAAGVGALEFLRTTEIVERTLPPTPAVVADIGGGPGRYTDWLVSSGYSVIHRDIVPDHVAQVRATHGDRVDTAVGDARSLDLADRAVDAVLHLGPLYHLGEASDRHQALTEAARVIKPGGMLYAAVIGRWSARLQGLLVERLYHDTPDAADRIKAIEDDGIIPAIFDGAFTANTHTPAQLREEVSAIPDLDLQEVVAIEGPASMFNDDDVAQRLDDDLDREVLLDSLRALEMTPDVMGVSAHLLAVARRT